MFIAITNDAGLAFVAEAETTLDAIRAFHADVGIDPHNQGLRAIADELTFYRLFDDEAAALDDGKVEWNDLNPRQLSQPEFEDEEDIAALIVKWMRGNEDTNEGNGLAQSWSAGNAEEAAAAALEVYRDGEPWSYELRCDDGFKSKVIEAIAAEIEGDFESAAA